MPLTFRWGGSHPTSHLHLHLDRFPFRAPAGTSTNTTSSTKNKYLGQLVDCVNGWHHWRTRPGPVTRGAPCQASLEGTRQSTQSTGRTRLLKRAVSVRNGRDWAASFGGFKHFGFKAKGQSQLEKEDQKSRAGIQSAAEEPLAFTADDSGSGYAKDTLNIHCAFGGFSGRRCWWRHKTKRHSAGPFLSLPLCDSTNKVTRT